MQTNAAVTRARRRPSRRIVPPFGADRARFRIDARRRHQDTHIVQIIRNAIITLQCLKTWLTQSCSASLQSVNSEKELFKIGSYLTVLGESQGR